MTRRITAILCAIGAACAPALGQPEYVTLFGTPYDASNGGNVVVGGGSGGTYRWVRTGNTATYTILPSSVSSGRAHCSSDGSVVITEMMNGTSNPNFAANISFAGRWTEATGMVNMGHFMNGGISGTTAQTPFDCSADGNFAVGLGYFGGGLTNFRGFLADFGSGTNIDLPQIGNDGSRANCVSDDGLVVGGWDRNPNTAADRPSVWRKDTMTGLYVQTILPTTGDPMTEAGTVEACDADGSYVAGRSPALSGQIVRWEWDGSQYVAVGLGLIPKGAAVPAAATYSTVETTGISADGNVIIGTVTWRQSINTFRRAIMWTPATGTVDLTDYMVSQGITGLASGTALVNGIGCSSDGTAIVGSNGIGGTGWLILRSGGVGCIQPTEVPTTSTTELSRCRTSAILNAAVVGTAPFTFQWQRNGVNVANGASGTGSTLSGATTNRLSINTADIDDIGAYTCVVTNACGMLTTVPIDLAMLATTANDTCATAVDVVGSNAVPFEMCGAYADTGGASCATSSIGDVWYRYTSTYDGELRISICGTNPSNTVISVYDGCGGTELTCNNDFCGTQSQIDRYNVTTGQVLYVRLAVAATTFSNGAGTITFSQPPARPANDDCANPQVITSVATDFDTSESTTDGTASCRAGSFRDLWYTYTTTRNATIDVNTCGSLFNTVLSLHASCAGPELACNDNSNVFPCTQQSAINDFRIRCGQTVLVRVAGNATGVQGFGNIIVEFDPNQCVGDFNNDGTISSQDFFDFLTEFFAAAPCADVNNTLDVTSQDFFDFIASFFGGC